jgi:predicted nucleic acid-binding Zn ribbon protein
MEKIIGGQGEAPKLNINLSDAPYMECDECQHLIFEEKMMIKKVSKFMTGNSQDSIVPIPVIACAKCGHINELFKPKV